MNLRLSRFSIGVSIGFFLVLGAACGTFPAALFPPTPTVTPTPTASPTPGPTPIPVADGWRLAWHDEFDGAAIDTSSWTYDIGGDGWGNAESEFYTSRPENARLENGMLVIEARRESYKGSKFTSARLKTQGLKTFQYGRVEARLQVPAGQGMWPAFWLLGEDIYLKGWPNCGEIDVMEYIGREPNTIFGTIHGPHYSGPLGPSKSYTQAAPISDGFHVYAIEWDEKHISWFFDDQLYSTWTPADLGGHTWVFDHPFFIILNLAVGGGWPGPVGAETVFPARYSVDYVRVFQKNP